MKRLPAVICIMLLAVSAFAGIGGLSFETLGKGLGIRELSMGEAGTANCRGAGSVFWNPAYLDSVPKNEIYLSVETLMEGANLEQISFASPVGTYGGIGASVILLNYPSYLKLDSDGVSLGNEGSMRDVAGTVGYGKTLFWGIQAGIGAKIFIKSVDDTAYTAFNMDAALYKPVNEMLDIGLTFRNVLPLSLKYSSEEEKFIPAARLGMLVKILENKLKIAVDTEKYFNDSQFLVYGGAEYSLGDMFFVRAGANTTGEIGAGAGFSFQDIVFDYGAGISEAMVSHKFALSYRFGGYELALKAEPDVFSPIGGNRKTYIRITARHKYSIYKWRLDITDGMGEIVKSWTGSGDPDSVEIWDGLRSDGMPMKEGEYRAVLKVTDENDVSSFSAPIKIKISNTDTFNIPLMGD